MVNASTVDGFVMEIKIVSKEKMKVSAEVGSCFTFLKSSILFLKLRTKMGISHIKFKLSMTWSGGTAHR